MGDSTSSRRRRSTVYDTQLQLNYTTTCIPGSLACDITPTSEAATTTVTQVTNLALVFPSVAPPYFLLATSTYDWPRLAADANNYCSAYGATNGRTAALNATHFWTLSYVECGSLPRLANGTCLQYDPTADATVSTNLVNIPCVPGATESTVATTQAATTSSSGGAKSDASTGSSSSSGTMVFAAAAGGGVVIIIIIVLVVLLMRKRKRNVKPNVRNFFFRFLFYAFLRYIFYFTLFLFFIFCFLCILIFILPERRRPTTAPSLPLRTRCTTTTPRPRPFTTRTAALAVARACTTSLLSSR